MSIFSLRLRKTRSRSVAPNPSIERTSQRPLRALLRRRSCRTLGPCRAMLPVLSCRPSLWSGPRAISGSLLGSMALARDVPGQRRARELPHTARASLLGRAQAEQTTLPCFRLRTEVHVSKEKHPLLAAAPRPLGSGSVFKQRSTLTRRSSGRPKACLRTL